MNVRPLKGYGAFDAVLHRGRRFSSGPVGLTIETSPDAPQPLHTVHVGVTIGKRTARAAVVRTRVRRLLRESARIVLDEHRQEILDLHVTTLILIWRQNPVQPSRIGLANVLPHVEEAVKKALRTIHREREQAQ